MIRQLCGGCDAHFWSIVFPNECKELSRQVNSIVTWIRSNVLIEEKKVCPKIIGGREKKVCPKINVLLWNLQLN